MLREIRGRKSKSPSVLGSGGWTGPDVPVYLIRCYKESCQLSSWYQITSCNNPSSLLPIYLSYLSNYWYLILSIYLSIYFFIYPLIYLSIYMYIFRSFLFIHPSSIHQPLSLIVTIYLSMRLSSFFLIVLTINIRVWGGLPIHPFIIS